MGIMRIDYKSDRIFPLMFIIIGITLIFCGMILLWTFHTSSPIPLVILLIGIIMVFTRRGTLLDFQNKRAKHYIGLFFIKLGSWKTITEYPFVTLLHIAQKSHGYSRTGVQFSERKKIYRICLLNQSHREKIKIKDFNEMETATVNCEKIAKNLNIEFVKYQPK